MQPYQEYLKTLKHNLAHGDSTEHTHRAALQTLLKAIAPDVDSVNEAQRIACGAPDLSMRKGGVPIGHIETKDVLDPATGTATFLYFVIRQIKAEMAGQEGAWPSYVHDHVLT